MKISTTTQNRLKNLTIIIFWIAVWQIISMIFNEEILFVSPFKVVQVLIRELKTVTFYISVFVTIGKSLLGFFMAFALAVLLAAGAAKWSFFRDFIYWPLMFVKAVPVVSFIVLLLFVVKSDSLAIWIPFLMVTPVVYFNIYDGILSVDRRYLELADIFQIGRMKRIRYIWISHLAPFLKASVSVGSGIAFKSGIAAEVIGLPHYGIGTRIYESKIYIDTGQLFAYTLVAILVAWLCERLMLKLTEVITG